MIPSWNGSQHRNARRVGPRLARRRLQATSLFYMTRPWPSLKLIFVVQSAAKAPIVGVSSRASAHTRRRANTSTPQTSYPVRGLKFIYFLMLKACRYKIHAMPHVAAMRIPGPNLPTQTSPGRQTYASEPQPAALDPQYDYSCPTGSLGHCSSSRGALRHASSPTAAASAALYDGPAHRGGRPRHSSRRGIRERKAPPPPNHSLSRDVHSGAGAPCRSTAPSVCGLLAGSGGGDAVWARCGHLPGTCA